MSKPGAQLLRGISILPVRHVPSAVQYYGKLGFAPDGQFGEEYAILSCDGCSLHLRHAATELVEGMNPAGAYLYVNDAQAWFERCRDAGVPTINVPEARPWGMIEFAVGDPDGNLLRIGQDFPAEDFKPEDLPAEGLQPATE